MPGIDYGEVVPPDDQDMLIQAGEDIDQNIWKIGQYAVQRCWKLRNTHSKVQVCASIAYFCKQSANTVRDYEYVARNVPQDVIDEFPVLSFAHFRLLVPYCDTAEDYIARLDGWLKDKKTLTHSVASLEAHLGRTNHRSPAWYRRFTSVRRSLEHIQDDEDADPIVRSASRQFLLATRGRIKE